MRVAYVGPGYGTSYQRFEALRRLGHTVTLIDPWSWLGHSRFVSLWLFHSGGAGVESLIGERVVAAVLACNPDFIWVDQVPFFGENFVRALKRVKVPVVAYVIDDPFGARDGRRFRKFLEALPYYDLTVVVRDVNVKEAMDIGCNRVIRVFMSADEVAHKPRELTGDRKAAFSSDVAFVGTWMPERGPFLLELLDLGVPLAIWGDRWNKAKEWPVLVSHWRGPGQYHGDDYASIIQSAKVCLGLLSKGNRDQHTTRSMEIPALGGLLCGERTSEHLQLYNEGVEALFWNGSAECANVCLRALADDESRNRIAANGRKRALRNGHFNEKMIAEVLQHMGHG